MDGASCLARALHEARVQLIGEGILNKKVADQPIKDLGAYEADNYDWRYLCAGVS